MRKTWTNWDPNDLMDAAEEEGWAGLSALAAPELRLLATLPYYSAFAEYQAHVTGCTWCRREDLMDCVKGEALLEVSRIGVTEQARTALSN